MKIKTILCLFLLATTSLFSQDAFERFYPVEGRKIFGADMAQTSDGGYLLLADVDTDDAEDSTQVNITKVNPKGNIEWSKDYSFDGNHDFLAKNIELLEQDSFIFSLFEYETIASNILCKAAPNGDLVWTKAYGDPEKETDSGGVSSFFIPSNQHFVLVSNSNRYENPSDPFPVPNELIYLGFIDSLGLLQHAQLLSAPDVFGGIILKGADATLDKGLIIAGTIFQDCLIKTDSLGQVEWNRTYFHEETIINTRLYTRNVISTLDEGYLVMGYWLDPNMPFPTHSKGFVLKVDRNGIPQWTVDMGFHPLLLSNLFLDNAVNTDDGGYIIAGHLESFANQDTDMPVAIKLDSLGNIVWKNKFPNYANTGFSSSRGFISTQNGGVSIYASDYIMPYLLKLDSTGSSSCEDSLELFIDTIPINTDTFIIESALPVDTLVEKEGTVKDFNGFTVPILSLESPPPFCEDDPIEWTFDATTPGAVAYDWNTGETTDSITVTEEGMYIVDVRIEENGCYNLCDTATISTIGPPMA